MAPDGMISSRMLRFIRRRAGMSNGGEVGSRGYIFQSIVALMDCLGRYDWDEIKVEPKTDQDKVDIQLYRWILYSSGMEQFCLPFR